MPSQPKINSEKMDQATKVLVDIMSLANNYNDLFKTLTPQEKVVIGGIVFCVRSNWSDSRMVGVMASREVAGFMIDTLVAFYQHPEGFKGSDSVPLIQSAKSGKDRLN